MPTGNIRTPYTDAEDNHFVEYMARFGSDKGRKGNKLYKDLVENLTRQSAWAASHPWQSWRDRYIKNSAHFDKRIRIFQKKNGLWKPGGTEGAEKEVKQDEAKKRKRVSNVSQEDAVTVKKPKVTKKVDSKGKGKEVTVNEDPELHLFVAFSKIPRRREKVDVDQGQGGGHHSVPSTSTADTSLKNNPRQVSHVKSVDGRSASNKRISAQEVRASPSTFQAPRQQIKTTTTIIESSQAVTKEGKDSHQRITDVIPISKSFSPAHSIGNKDVGHEVEARSGSESPLFTQHVKHDEPGSPLFTQRARDDSLGEDVSDEEDYSMVNHLLVVPPEARVDDHRVVSRKPVGGESDEEYSLLYPLLQSPQQASIISKASCRPSTNKTSRDNRSISTTQAEVDPQLKATSKKPPKYLEGPYRTQLVGSNLPKARSDPDSDAAEDLIPQVGGKTQIKKPPPTQAKPSTSKPVRKRVISDGSGVSSPLSSPVSTPAPPRKRVRSVRSADSRNVVLSSEGDVDMKISGHGENPDIQVEAPTHERHARAVQKSEVETDEEDEEGESATEVEHADEVHPFDIASQPPRTPRSTRHPFEMPPSQMFSHSSIRSHVSERDMERVIKTLERFISKLDTDRRDRLLERPFRSSEKAETTERVEAGDEENPGEQEEEEEAEEAEEIDDDAMVLDEDDQKLQRKLFTTISKGKEREHAANLRERGSPLPLRNSKSVKQSILQTASPESEVVVVPQSSGNLPPSSPPPVQIGEGSDSNEPMDVEEAKDGTARSVSPDKRVTEPFASPPNQIERAEPTAAEGETQTTHDSLFSSSETSETQRQFSKAADKGKARATVLPVLSDEEDARYRRHTIAMVNEENLPQELDLRRVARARRRSLPSRSSISTGSLGYSAGQWAPSSSTRRTFDLEKPLRMRLSETDQTKLIELNVERMALQYGFPESFVFGIWNDCGSLDETESILSELGSKLEDLLDRSRRRRASVDFDVNLPLSRTVTPQDTTRMESDLNKEQMSVPSTVRTRGRSTVSPSRPTQSKRNSPQFKPTLVGDDEIPESDYNPPVASRAGKFRRLSRQGRTQEALERESRRASGGILKGNKS